MALPEGEINGGGAPPAEIIDRERREQLEGLRRVIEVLHSHPSMYVSTASGPSGTTGGGVLFR